MQVLLIRHADPDYEHDAITPRGHWEAARLAAALAEEGLDAIYVSCMGRAQATARYVAQAVGLVPTTLDWLREVRAARTYGSAAWEVPGHHVLGREELPDLTTWRSEPLIGRNFVSYHDAISAGFDQVLRERGYAKEGHLYRVERSSEERLAFVGHKGTTLTLLSYLLHWPLPILFPHCDLDPTGVVRLHWREGEGFAVPRMLRMNDLSHLKGGVSHG